MSDRKPLKKSTRFAVFSRDGYTCRYCGRKSDEVKLVIDHVIPVVEGGTNDEANLATSCDECNSGKGTKAAKPDPNNENVRLAAFQSQRELVEAAAATVAAAKADAELRQVVINAWCDITGRDTVDRSTINVMVRYVRQHGFQTVVDWMWKAHIKAPRRDKDMGRYVSGIRRCIMKEENQ